MAIERERTRCLIDRSDSSFLAVPWRLSLALVEFIYLFIYRTTTVWVEWFSRSYRVLPRGKIRIEGKHFAPVNCAVNSVYVRYLISLDFHENSSNIGPLCFACLFSIGESYFIFFFLFFKRTGRGFHIFKNKIENIRCNIFIST